MIRKDGTGLVRSGINVISFVESLVEKANGDSSYKSDVIFERNN